MNYKKCEIIKSSLTTEVTKNCFGRAYQTIVNVYEITGIIEKRAGMRPFLTSIIDCKNFITDKIAHSS